MFQIAVVSTQEWDSNKAANQIIDEILKKLRYNPTAILLFATIHYEKEFKNILSAIYFKIPKKTPLTGGSVTGFMTNQGCFTRGIVSLAIYSDEISVAVGAGHQTKKHPLHAASECANQIKSKLSKNNFPGKFIFENTSNGTVPKLPFLGQKKVLKIPFSNIAMKGFDFFNNIFQYGVGREGEVLDKLAEFFPEYTILATANYDDFKAFSNYQFLNNEIHTNSVSAIAINTNLNIQLITTFGLKATGTKFTISNKCFHGCSFGSIDGKKATDELFQKLGWSKDFLTELIYRKTNYYPIGYLVDNKISAHVAGLFIGDHICYTHQFKKDELELFTTSGRALLQATQENLAQIASSKEQIKFALLVECAIRLETLGRKSYIIYDELQRFFGEIPFLLLYGAGEGTYMPKSVSNYFNLSFNTTIFSEQNEAHDK